MLRARYVASLLIGLLSGMGTLAGQAARAAGPVHSIGTQTQIFVDDVLIARKRGVVRKAHPCKKLFAPVLEPEKPWERDDMDRRIYVYGTVLPDRPFGDASPDGSAGGLRLWYNRNHLVLYATSADGLNWSRPELGLHVIDGSKENNVVFPHFHSPSIVYNDEERERVKRYQMLGYGRLHGRGYYAAHSEDGIEWMLHPRNPVLPGGDNCTLALDPKTGEYLAFHKRTHHHLGKRRRLIYLATSPDMQHWSEPELVLAPDEEDDARVRSEGGRYSQFYNMSAFPYGGQFLGLVTHFRYTGPPPVPGPLQSGDDGPVDVQLVHSRDGRTWHRCEDRSPVIPNGPHDYDAGCVLGVTNGPVIAGDELWLYYTAITTTHGGYVPKKKITIALARWRLDGLVSLDAHEAGGLVETVPLRFSGDRLMVNADARDGELAVAVLDEDGRPLWGFSQKDCVPLRTDSVRHEVRWKDRDRLPPDQPVRLRFVGENFELFGYAVAE
jgi:hypothetical protein